MKIGISTLGFRELTNAQLEKELAAAGFTTIQLFLAQSDSRFWKYNDRSDVTGLTPERCGELADIYRSAGLAIHSLGVYTNLMHPDEVERRANLAYFEAMLEIGDHMGVRTFITEAGHYQHPTEPEPRVPLHFQEPVWPRMIATARELATTAAKFHGTILLEPFYRGFFASARRTRLFLEEINSPFIRALLDAANLIEVNDLEEMFAQLGPWIDCIHAKDRKLHLDRGVAAGQGDLDYEKSVKLAAKHAPHAPLILEYVGMADYRGALTHLRGAMRAAGVKED